MKLPEAVALNICERVEVIPGTRGISLVGLFQVLRLPSFPSGPQAFTVFAALYDGEGEGIIQLTFMRMEDEGDIYHYRRWIKFAGRQNYAHLELRVTSCIFPAPGRYCLKLLFEGQQVTERFLDVYRE